MTDPDTNTADDSASRIAAIRAHLDEGEFEVVVQMYATLLAALDANDKAQAVARLSGSYSAAHVNGVADELDKADFAGAAKMLRNLLARHKRMLRNLDAALDEANKRIAELEAKLERMLKWYDGTDKRVTIRQLGEERDALKAALERAPEPASWERAHYERWWVDMRKQLYGKG